MSCQRRAAEGWLRRGVWVLACLLMYGSLQAQVTAPLPKITSVYPLGGQAGSTLDLTVRGTDLDGSRSLLFTPRPIPAFHVQPKRDANGLPLPGQFSVTLPPDATPGRYDIRFVGTFGLSNVRRFEVGSLPEVEAAAEHFKPESPLKVALNTTVNATAKSNAPLHLLIDGKKGQRILVVCRGESLDTQLSSAGRAYDPAGREIARMQDQVIDFTPAANGPHAIQIHDLMYRTGDTTGFRVTVTDQPLIRIAMRTSPSGKAVIYGLNLPNGKPSPKAGLECAEIDPKQLDPLLITNLLEVATLDREDVPPDAPTSAVTLHAGQTYGGWFPAFGLPQTFELPLKKGQRYVIEVVSSQLGLPTDPTLFIESVKTDDTGKETVTTQAEVLDLGTPSPFPMLRRPADRDPSYTYTAPADGKFRLHLTDTANSVGKTRYPFELRIRDSSSQPLIATPAALALPKNDRTGVFGSSNIWRGGIVAFEVVAPYRAGLSDALMPYIAGCPPGVTCLGGFMGTKQGTGYIAFQAENDAPAIAVSLADWKGPGAEILATVKDSNREPLRIRQTRGAVLGVVESTAPARVEIVGQQPFEVASDSKLEIALKAVRHKDFTDALKMKVLGLIDSDKAPTGDIPAKTDDGKITLDIKTLKLAPGDYGCILQGTAKMKTARGIEELALAAMAATQAGTDLTAAKKNPANTDAIQKAEQAKAAADKVLADRKARATPKDAVFLVYSQPIRIRVTEPVKK